MQYTKYFSGVVKNQGIPHVNQEQFSRMMNIIHLEGVLNGLNRAKKTHLHTPQHNRYDILLFKVSRQLSDLTGNLPPNQLLREMIIKN